MDIYDHYWVVGGDQARVWSSKKYAYVNTDDGDYLAWLSIEEADPTGQFLIKNEPTKIADENELSSVLEAYGMDGLVIKPAQIYAESKRRKMLIAGQTDEASYDEAFMRGISDAARFNDIRATGGALTPDQETRRLQLEQMYAAFDVIDAKADVLIAMSPIPFDYKDDVHWA